MLFFRTSFSSTMNKLVECVDCHRHYHQNCHFPPITDMDLNDPRLVWYCSTCEDNISATNLSVSKIFSNRFRYTEWLNARRGETNFSGKNYVDVSLYSYISNRKLNFLVLLFNSIQNPSVKLIILCTCLWKFLILVLTVNSYWKMWNINQSLFEKRLIHVQ